MGIQIALAAVPPLVFAVLMFCWPGMKIWATLTAISVTLVDFGLLDPLHKRWRKTAAQIQEAFDCDVLNMDWTTLRAGKQPPPEDVMRYATKISRDPGKVAKLRDWYPTVVSQLPDELARLLCQRTNCHWDATLRATYSRYLVLFLWGVVLTVFVLGALTNLTFEGFVLAMLAPATPAIVLALRQTREQGDSARTSEQLREHIDSLWSQALNRALTLPALTSESRALQSEIFLRRATVTPVFEWLYNILAKSQQTYADRTAEELVKEAKERLSLL